jgi:hypothetical protein
MTQIAKQVFTERADIDRLDHWISELAVNAQVRITTHDGEVLEGLVMVTPTVQVFRDHHDLEGLNGVVKLENLERSERDQVVWLGDIRELEHLDSVRKGVSKA